MNTNFLIFGLSGATQLTKQTCEKLNIAPSPVLMNKFADGEILCRPGISVRNKKVLIIQSLSTPIHENIMELLLMIDAVKRASAKEINIAIPYFAYARQDRKSNSREPISSKLIANMIEKAGADRILLFDLHSDQIQGFFNIPIDSVNSSWTLLQYVMSIENKDNLCFVSADFGGIARVRKLSNLLNYPMVVIDKKREVINNIEIMNILGDVKNKTCFLIDDMIDTGNTILKTAKLLKENNAARIILVASHGLFSKDALTMFAEYHEKGYFQHVYVSDSVTKMQNIKLPFLTVVSIDQFLADIIQIYKNGTGAISEIYQIYKSKILKLING